MVRRSLFRARRSCSPSRKSSAARNRALGGELLEPRALLSGNGFSSLVMGIASPGPVAMVGAVAPANTGPIVTQAIIVNGNLPVTGKTASLSVLGVEGTAKLVYNWSVTTRPAGGSATFGLNGSSFATNTTVTFTEAGAYTLAVTIVDASGRSVSTSKVVAVTPTLTSIGVSTAAGQAVKAGSILPVTGVSQALVAHGLDQFGNVMVAQPALVWSTTSLPVNAGPPIFATNSGVTTVTFTMAGYYSLVTSAATTLGISSLIAVNVGQTAASIALSPNKASVLQGAAQQFTARAFDQFGQVMASQPTFTWSAGGGTISTAGLFTAPISGSSCIVTARSGAATGTATVTLLANPILTSIVLSPNTASVIEGATQQFTARAYDQFGQQIASQPTFTWSASGGTVSTAGLFTAPISGSSCTVTARSGAATGTATVALLLNPNQILTSIVLSPNTPSVLQGATQQFTAKALDQFGVPMANQQIFTWSAGSGTIGAAGLFTAPGAGSSCTVTVKSGSVTGTATVTLLTNTGKLQDPALAQLVQSLDADGSISRQDMIQILHNLDADGTVNATDFCDLKEILYQAATLNIPGYVQALAGDVINGNFANATYQGWPLGNLTVGSSTTQLDALINKWFFGTDHPVLCNTSLVYTSTAGSLFPHTPSHTDEYQGQMGDCYFISAMGTLADSNPAAVENMFINNGDGTYTVRFYTGTYGTIYNYSDGSIGAGFQNNNITTDYVTVDSMLPASPSGILAYADYSASCTNTANSLWIPLAEKAYAQWNETGKEGRDDTNNFASIQGGWMATVDAQVLGHNATDYIMTSTNEQTAVSALTANKAVTIGTKSWSGTTDGLYAGHAYAIVGYDQSSDTFTLYNPWGMDQPSQLSWSRLQADCTQMAVCDASRSVPISGAVPKVGAAAAFSCNSVSGAAATWLRQAGTATFSQAAPGSLFSAPAGTSRELFGTLERNGLVPSRQTRVAGPAHDTLSAPLVDAAFAADGVLANG